MIKIVRHEAENARVAIRNIRRDANQHLKGLIKDEHLAKDDEHRAEDEVQKLTDRFVTKVDELLKAKEQDLMEF
jgi:ribosome recycling factor